MLKRLKQQHGQQEQYTLMYEYERKIPSSVSFRLMVPLARSSHNSRDLLLACVHRLVLF